MREREPEGEREKDQYEPDCHDDALPGMLVCMAVGPPAVGLPWFLQRGLQRQRVHLGLARRDRGHHPVRYLRVLHPSDRQFMK